MKRRPLAQDFGPRARIYDLVGRDARELIGRGVADAIARRLDAVHLHRGELRENFGGFFELDPVELDVRARREVAVAAIVLARDARQHAQLVTAQVSVRNRDAVHVSMALHVEPVLQAQRTELLFAQFARQTAANLVAILRDALIDECLVVLIVLIHSGTPGCSAPRPGTRRPNRYRCKGTAWFRPSTYLLITKTAKHIVKGGEIVINCPYISNY